MGCLEALKYEILLKQCSFREASDFIRKTADEIYEVRPGFKIFDVHIIGIPPVIVGIDGDFIIFPYTKPCHGTFLLRVRGDGEIARVRSRGKRLSS
jgi:hypothetical protein